MWPAGIGIAVMALAILLLMAGETVGQDRRANLVFVAETWFILAVLGLTLWVVS